MDKITKAFNLFDEYNRQDPNKIVFDGSEYPAEYFYAFQLYNWVLKLAPHASESLLLAARCQHIGRWQIPREQYPPGKAGYLRWRSDLAIFHGNIARELLTTAGFSGNQIEEVRKILLKENLKNDGQVQVMENALCLVFLEFQFEDFLSKHDDEKVVRILQKSWKKMSEPGRTAALALQYSPKGRSLLTTALGK